MEQKQHNRIHMEHNFFIILNADCVDFHLVELAPLAALDAAVAGSLSLGPLVGAVSCTFVISLQSHVDVAHVEFCISIDPPLIEGLVGAVSFS